MTDVSEMEKITNNNGRERNHIYVREKKEIDRATDRKIARLTLEWDKEKNNDNSKGGKNEMPVVSVVVSGYKTDMTKAKNFF